MPRAPRPRACGVRLLPQVEWWGRAASDHCAFPPEALVLPSVAAASLPWCAGTRWRTAASSSPASRAGTTPRRPGSQLVSPLRPPPPALPRPGHLEGVMLGPGCPRWRLQQPLLPQERGGCRGREARRQGPCSHCWALGSDGSVCSCRVLGDSLLHVVSGCQTQEAARRLFRLSCDL